MHTCPTLDRGLSMVGHQDEMNKGGASTEEQLEARPFTESLPLWVEAARSRVLKLQAELGLAAGVHAGGEQPGHVKRFASLR